MSQATVSPATSSAPPLTLPDLDTFARVDRLGLTVTGQRIWPDRAELFCQPTISDEACPGCGEPGRRHDTATRRFTHLPMGRKATWLVVAQPRYRCGQCRKVWRHRLQAVARPRSMLTRDADFWALSQVVLDHSPVSAIAAVLGVSWDTAHTALAEVGQQLLIDNPGRLDGVEVVGVDEHAVRHEALLIRMEVRDLDRLAVVAVG